MACVHGLRRRGSGWWRCTKTVCRRVHPASCVPHGRRPRVHGRRTQEYILGPAGSSASVSGPPLLLHQRLGLTWSSRTSKPPWSYPTAAAPPPSKAMEHFSLSDAPDQLVWKWTASGTYTARSCYLATLQGSTTFIWKIWAPPRLKFFHWLANLDRCWTADRLARRGLQHQARCPLCDHAPETMRHLLLECPFAKLGMRFLLGSE